MFQRAIMEVCEQICPGSFLVGRLCVSLVCPWTKGRPPSRRFLLPSPRKLQREDSVLVGILVYENWMDYKATLGHVASDLIQNVLFLRLNLKVSPEVNSMTVNRKPLSLSSFRFSQFSFVFLTIVCLLKWSAFWGGAEWLTSMYFSFNNCQIKLSAELRKE